MTGVGTQPLKKRTSLVNEKITLYRDTEVFTPWLVREELKYERQPSDRAGNSRIQAWKLFVGEEIRVLKVRDVWWAFEVAM